MNSDNRQPQLRSEESITIIDAYSAAYQFLLIHYKRFGAQSDIGIVLHEMQFSWTDGSTADPALWFDWLKCVDQAAAKKIDLGNVINKGDE